MASVTDEPFDVGFHVAVVGDHGIGKTSLVRYEVYDTLGTVAENQGKLNGDGISFHSRVYSDRWTLPNDLSGEAEEKSIATRITYWDATGKVNWLEEVARLCATCSAVVYVFDVRKRASFNNARLLMHTIAKYVYRDQDAFKRWHAEHRVAKRWLRAQKRAAEENSVSTRRNESRSERQRRSSSISSLTDAGGHLSRHMEDGPYDRETSRKSSMGPPKMLRAGTTPTPKVLPKSSSEVFANRKPPAIPKFTAPPVEDEEEMETIPFPVQMLIGTRVDQVTDSARGREVTTGEANSFVRQFERVFYYETSGKTGTGIKQAFQAVREELMEQMFTEQLTHEIKDNRQLVMSQAVRAKLSGHPIPTFPLSVTAAGSTASASGIGVSLAAPPDCTLVQDWVSSDL